MSILDRLKTKEKKAESDDRPKSLPPDKLKEEQGEKRPSPRQSEKKIVGVLVKPMVTEKSAFVGQYGQYIFEVSLGANKIQIAKAIQSMYGVKPTGVNIVTTKGKKVRYGKTSGQTKKRKKAIVTFKPGEKIEIHSGV